MRRGSFLQATFNMGVEARQGCPLLLDDWGDIVKDVGGRGPERNSRLTGSRDDR